MLEILKWFIMKYCASVYEKPISKDKRSYPSFHKESLHYDTSTPKILDIKLFIYDKILVDIELHRRFEIDRRRKGKS